MRKSRMDHAIYGQLPRNDYGVYGTRRYPKGVASAGSGADMSLPENRNPLVVVRSYTAAQVAVIADSVKWTYEVPRMRRAVLQSALVELSRSAAGAANPMNYSSIYLTRAGNSAQASAPVVRVTHHSDTLPEDRGERQLHTGPVDLYEGDILRALINVGSGNISILAVAHILEYDSIETVTGQDFVLSNEGSNPGLVGGFSGGGFSAIRAPSGGGGYAAKYPTAYAMAKAQGYSETQARIAGDTGMINPKMAG